MDDDEFSKLVISEKDKRARCVIRQVARSIEQFDGNAAGESSSEIEALLNASEVPLAVHTLRMAYEERGIEQSEKRRELVWLIGSNQAALEQLFQCNYDFEAS